MGREHDLAQVANRYRCEGYQVIVRPGADDLPPFVVEQAVDLLAHNDDEKVLVLVKENQEDLRDAPEAIRMAEQVNAQPGWRLDLVVLNADAPEYKVSPGATEPPAEQIEQSLALAERMLTGGDVQLSCVMSWAGLEAAMRHAARTAGMEVKQAAPAFLLRALYSGGFLHKNEFDQLDDALKIRNAVVHGMTVPVIDPGVPRLVVRAARKLLANNGQAAG